MATQLAKQRFLHRFWDLEEQYGSLDGLDVSIERVVYCVMSWDILTHLLYFDSPDGLAKIQRDL